MGQSQMQFGTQGFNPGMAGGVAPATAMGGAGVMPGVALTNGGYVGVPQQQQGVMSASQGQSMYMQPGQWNMSQVT